MQEIDHLFVVCKRAVGFALFEFRDAPCKLRIDATALCRRIFIAIDDEFGFENDLAILGICLEHAADIYADSVADGLRDDDLVFILDCDEGYDFGLFTNCTG